MHTFPDSENEATIRARQNKISKFAAGDKPSDPRAGYSWGYNLALFCAKGKAKQI